jgi:hypothetical protein
MAQCAIGSRDVPGDGNHQPNRQIGNCLVVGARTIGDDNSKPFGGIQVDMVDTNTVHADHFELRGAFHYPGSHRHHADHRAIYAAQRRLAAFAHLAFHIGFDQFHTSFCQHVPGFLGCASKRTVAINTLNGMHVIQAGLCELWLLVPELHGSHQRLASRVSAVHYPQRKPICPPATAHTQGSAPALIYWAALSH